MDTVYGLMIFLAIVLSPALLALVGMGLHELWERAYLRGHDDAWQLALTAQECGKRLV